MKLEQEIIDIENFYATATLEEAIAYFKAVSNKCFAVVKAGCAEVVRSVKGLIARFGKPVPSNRRLRSNISPTSIYANKLKPAISFDDFAGMEETLEKYKEHLYKSSKN